MMIFLGVCAALFFVADVVTAMKHFNQSNREDGKFDSIEAALYFIAMCIYFK